MRVAGIQHDIVWEDPSANFARLADTIARAAADGARLIALTEMYSHGFSMETDRIAEPVGGPSARFLVEQAAATGAWVCGSVPERADDHPLPYNQLVLAAPDGTVHRYAKIHPFTYADEHHHYRAGDRHVTVDVEGVRTSLFVCYDLRFADEFWPLAPDTDLYVVVANWPAKRRRHWRTLLRARAIENQAYVLAVNRVGEGSGLHYCGDSVLLDPMGDVIDEAPEDVEAVVAGDVDPETVTKTRARYPFLQDRRS